MFMHKINPADVEELERIKRLIVTTAQSERPDLLVTKYGNPAITMDADSGVEWLLFCQFGDDMPPGAWHDAVNWMRARFPAETRKGGELARKAHKVRLRGML